MKIQIDGVDYDLDVQAARVAGCLHKTVVHRAGNRYFTSKPEDCYVLAQIEQNKYGLINVKSGNRYSDDWILCNIMEPISEEKFRKHAQGLTITSIGLADV